MGDALQAAVEPLSGCSCVRAQPVGFHQRRQSFVDSYPRPVGEHTMRRDSNPRSLAPNPECPGKTATTFDSTTSMAANPRQWWGTL